MFVAHRQKGEVMGELKRLAGIAALPIVLGLAVLIAVVSMIAYNSVRITTHNADRWTGTDMHRWAGELAKRNPMIDVPETKHKNIQAGAAIINRIGDIVEWSGDARKLTGWTDKVGGSIDLMLPVDDRGTFRNRLTDLNMNAQPREPMLVAVTCADGQSLPVALSVSRLDEGRYSAVFVTR